MHINNYLFRCLYSMHWSNITPGMNLINFHESTVIKITLEHQKNLIHKDIKKYL